MSRYFALAAGVLLVLTAVFYASAAPLSAPDSSTDPHNLAPGQADEFRPALPGYTYQFPRDHGSHPPFQTEWWYYTGQLRAADGHRFGYQLTWFRTAMVPSVADRESKWAVRDLIFAHLALTDETTGEYFYDDRISRTSLGLAGAEEGAENTLPRVWLEDWRLRFGGKNGDAQTLQATGAHDGTRFGLNLTQRATKPPVVHGTDGVSQKAEGRGRASHYYSYTRLKTTGTVRVNGQEYAVTGESWFDHEFGSNQLAADQVGWDWFSLQLDDERELMLYQLRTRDGGVDPYSSATLVAKDGTSRHLTRDEFVIEPLGTWVSPRTKASYPNRWRVTLPREQITLEIKPTVADQELDTARSTGVTYWEGSVDFTGTQRDRALSGEGYVELTGYAGSLSGKF